MTGSQLLLLRFAYAETSSRHRAPPSSLPPPLRPPPPKTPKPKRHSSLGSPKSEPRVPPKPERSTTSVEGKQEEAFRPESWHGSRAPPRRSEEGEIGGRGVPARSSSASPPHASWPSRARSHSLDNDSSKKVIHGEVSVSGGEGVGEKGGGESTVEDSVGGMRPKAQRGGKLWGERETGLAGGDGGSRHVYLGDMGHARAQRTLQFIAEDVQVLYFAGLRVVGCTRRWCLLCADCRGYRS